MGVTLAILSQETWKQTYTSIYLAFKVGKHLTKLLQITDAEAQFIWKQPFLHYSLPPNSLGVPSPRPQTVGWTFSPHWVSASTSDSHLISIV